MRLSFSGRCGNCQSVTIRVTAASDDANTKKRNRREQLDRRVYQCRECSSKGVKPVAHEKKPARTELPRLIENALASASYRMRSPDGEGFSRVIATIPTFGSVTLGSIDSREALATHIERVWPGLDNAQFRRVIKHIDAGCDAAIQAMTQPPGRPKSGGFAMRSGTDYPIKTERDF